eukprot:TRINITY_DN664_c0_g2_i2.p1 TRINITY_DN664_c0_g2~~TRINITY_DN664_c0_g2_i2.p1  ORF type:complete len:490 (+),score=105.94 TRINITY_DN664_c0_g2_i2:390-1859(+)
MEGSADDFAAPDSWEIADLDVAVTRLMLSSKKNPTDPSESAGDPTASTASSSSAAAASSSPEMVSADRAGGSSEDASNQVDQFLREALQNPRERLSILRMEQDIVKFIREPAQQQLEFQQLPTSYLRLAAHRVAQHYNLQSTVMLDNSSSDGSGSRIIVRKTSECHLPMIRLVDIPVNVPEEDNSNVIRVAIKQRPQKHSQAANYANSHSSRANHSKSVEERKEEYNRARARIFNNSNSVGGSGRKPEVESSAFDTFQHCPSLASTRLEEKASIEGPEINLGRGLGDSSMGGGGGGGSGSSSSSRLSRNKPEKEPIPRNKPNNRVAIFRDREVDRKDPDYDRSYDRYMQRFDPGFGFNGGQYTMQPMYSPALNYNTEFPQLGSAHRPQISIEHQPRSIHQHMRGPWTPTSNPTAIGYPPPESMLAPPPPPFSPNHVGAHSTSAIYMHSSQYGCPRPGMPYVHPSEHVHQPFAQPHHQNPEAGFGLARPR